MTVFASEGRQVDDAGGVPGSFASGIAVALLWLAVMTGTARAEPVLDAVLSEVRVVEARQCSKLKIVFNTRVRYAGHAPTGRGQALAIRIRAIDPTIAATLSALRREALRPVATRTARITTIEFDAKTAAGPTLRIEFDRPVLLDAAQGADFTSIVVSLANSSAKQVCKPEISEGSGWQTSIAAPALVSAAKPVRQSAGKLDAEGERKIGGLIDEARAAMKKKNFKVAIAKLRKAVAAPSNAFSKEALELLGSAYQRSGDHATARVYYTDYLTRYPGDDDARRVAQRLAAIDTALGAPPERRRAARGPREAESGSTWMVSGSASQFYVRDDSYRKLRDPSLPPLPNADPDDHRVHRNAVLSGFDLSAQWANSVAKTKFRFSGLQEHYITGDRDDQFSVSALYLDTFIRPYNLGIRLGRMTESSNGVLGRYDGGSVSWRLNDLVRLGAVAGSPVARRSDEPFKDDKVFYGASVGLTPVRNLDLTFYGIDQRARSLIDRQALGIDVRYLGNGLSAFATLDYDVHFNEINLALANVSWTLPSKTVIHAGYDQRKSPFLTSWSALQGQPFLTLYDMLKLYTKDEIYGFALDRSSTYRSATAGISHPLTDKLQIAADITWTNVEGSVATGGVPGLPGTGNEFYYSAQMIGTDWFKAGDSYIAGIRFADRQFSDLWVLDLQARYPVTNALKISPRLRLGYLEGNGIDLEEFSVMPSLLVDYAVTKNTHFEIEVGANRIERRTGPATETVTDYFITAGYRIDFYTDGRTDCALPGLLCLARARR